MSRDLRDQQEQWVLRANKARLARRGQRESKVLPDLKDRRAIWAKPDLRGRRGLKVLLGKRETRASKAKQVLLEKKALQENPEQPLQPQQLPPISMSFDRILASHQVAPWLATQVKHWLR